MTLETGAGSILRSSLFFKLRETILVLPEFFQGTADWTFSIGSGLKGSGRPAYRAQKSATLRFKTFQVGAHGVIVPAEDGADAQCGFAAARLRPARSQSYGYAAQQHISQGHGKFSAIGFDYFRNHVRSVRTDWRAKFSAHQRSAGDVCGAFSVPFQHAAGGFFAHGSDPRNLENSFIQQRIKRRSLGQGNCCRFGSAQSDLSGAFPSQ